MQMSEYRNICSFLSTVTYSWYINQCYTFEMLQISSLRSMCAYEGKKHICKENIIDISSLKIGIKNAAR